MPAVVLYREGITLGERWARCGFGLPLKSLRASWQRVQVDVDHLEFSVRTATRHVLMMPPGRHEIHVRGRGFAPSATTVDLTGEQRVIVAITPQYLESVSRSTPLGQLRAHVVSGPEELQPYRFYKSWPLFISALGSSTVAGLGAAAVAAAVYVLTQHVLAGFLLLACVSVVAPTLLFSGIGGLVMAVRFLRLSSDWRAPGKGWSTSGSWTAAHLDLVPRRAVINAFARHRSRAPEGGRGLVTGPVQGRGFPWWLAPHPAGHLVTYRPKVSRKQQLCCSTVNTCKRFHEQATPGKGSPQPLLGLFV